MLSKYLRVGDLLKSKTGAWKPILSIEKVERKDATYNFEVKQNHDYFVGEIGWLFHNQSIWTSKGSQSSVENAFSHWQKHKSEFPEFSNAKQYVEGAKDFLNNPSSGVLTKTRATNGDVLLYDTSTNTFGVRTFNGTPRTMFRPPDGLNYWLKQ